MGTWRSHRVCMTRAHKTLHGTAALITGASRGLGLGLARALGRRGASVALVARERHALEDSVRALQDEGIAAFAFAADVADKRAVHPLAGRITATLGKIDILVHNASTLGPTPLRALADIECEEFSDVLETNLIGPFRLTKAVLGPMVARGAGLLVHISSDAAVHAYPTWGPYAVSKAALDHLSRIWAAELEGTGVRSVAIDPGEMDTAMHAAAIPDADPSSLARPADVGESIAAQIERWSGDASPPGPSNQAGPSNPAGPRLAVAGAHLEVA